MANGNEMAIQYRSRALPAEHSTIRAQTSPAPRRQSIDFRFLPE
jgi:hypothetical protein